MQSQPAESSRLETILRRENEGLRVLQEGTFERVGEEHTRHTTLRSRMKAQNVRKAEIFRPADPV